MPMWRYAVITLLREAARAGVLETDMPRGERCCGYLTAQYERWWNIDVKRFKQQEAVPRLCRPLRPPAAHRAAPVPDDQPSRNPVCDDGHALETHRRDHVHAAGVPVRARPSRARPLPAQRALLRSARASCEEPDTRCGVCTAGASTAREAAATVVGSLPAEKLRG